MASIRESNISTHFLRSIRDHYRNEPTIRMAVSVIKKNLLGSGFSLTTRSLNRPRKRPRAEIMSDDEVIRWTTFLDRALDEILCWGFIAFHDDLREVDIERCHVFIHRDTRVIRIQPFDSSETVTVMNAFSSSPTVHGEIVSTMTSLRPWIEFMIHIRNCAKHLEERKVRPELIYNKLPVPTREEDTIGQEYYADADDFGKKSEERVTITRSQRDTISREQLKDEIMNDQLIGPDRAHSGAETYVPDGHKLANIVSLQARGDIVSVTRMVQQIICGALGVPRTMIINDSVARADTEATHTLFRNTLQTHKKNLNHVLTVAYNALHSNGSVYSIAQLNDAYYGPPETLTQMWILGLIDEETYRKTFTGMFGITMNPTPTAIFSEDERRELARDSIRNMVTQHHGRT